MEQGSHCRTLREERMCLSLMREFQDLAESTFPE